MDTETTRALARRMYDAYARGDGETVVGMLHDEIDWLIQGPVEVFPFAGVRKGKEEVARALETIAQRYELQRYVPEIIVADGDRAAALSNVAFVQRATRRTLAFSVVNFLRFEDGRLIEFRELLDSFDVTQQALGRWLKV